MMPRRGGASVPSVCAAERCAGGFERGALLRRWDAQRGCLERHQPAQTIVAERALDERRGARPALRVDSVAGERGVAEERGDRDVGDADLAEQESVLGKLRFQIVEHVRDLHAARVVQHRLVGRHAEHARIDRHLVEQTPDDHLAHARIGELLEPARARAVGRLARIERGGGVEVFEVLADHRGIAQRHLAIGVHRNPPQRRERAERFVAEERNDRVDLIGDALQVEHREHLAHVRRDVAADDRHRAGHG